MEFVKLNGTFVRFSEISAFNFYEEEGFGYVWLSGVENHFRKINKFEYLILKNYFGLVKSDEED